METVFRPIVQALDKVLGFTYRCIFLVIQNYLLNS